MVGESGGSIIVCLRLTGELKREVVVSLLTADAPIEGRVPATPELDYRPLLTDITFVRPNVECASFDFMVVQDLTLERNESIALNLVTNDSAVNILSSMNEVIILDSDRKMREHE